MKNEESSRMKKYIVLAMCLISLEATAQDRIIVHLKDGGTVSYNIGDVEYVELQTSSKEMATDTIQNIGGTIAEAIDLGTSCKWAAHNIGASHSSDRGKMLSWEDAQSIATLWGEGWRLPTAEEWKDLFEKCTWTWCVMDGIGGRMVTGTDNSSMFLPASGFNIEDYPHVVGCLGAYWSCTSTSSASAESTASYFDSANIYQLAMPKKTQFSIRLVKD